MRYVILLLLTTQVVLCASSFDRSSALIAERMAVTSDFAAAQAALKNAKTSFDSDAASTKLESVADKILSLRAKTVQANENLISILSGQGYPFSGERDPSATIKATYQKLRVINTSLNSLTFTANKPYQPRDVNTLQILLDRTKSAIDEHKHAVQNIETRLAQLKR